MSAKSNYLNLIKEIPPKVTLVAVSKGFSWENVKPAYDAGCRNFGENRIQEALPKIEEAPKDIQWHFIGPLQLNKVRKAIGRFVLIHSVDDPKLAKKISECSLEVNLVTSILLQVNTSGEESKQGLSPTEWREAFKEVKDLPGISIRGLMTIAPLTEDKERIRSCFADLRLFRDELVDDYKISLPDLSMGMSHDYHLAIEEGATLLRIGSQIFKS